MNLCSRFHCSRMGPSKRLLGIFITLLALSFMLIATPKQDERFEILAEQNLASSFSNHLGALDMSALCQEDQKRHHRMNFDGIEDLTLGRVQSYFAQILQYPVQTGCVSMKRIGGGKWSGLCYDGHKYVCLDDFVPKRNPAIGFDQEEDECIVYSFGVSNDLTFENEMTHFGCQVYAFDQDWTETMLQNKNPRITLDKAIIHDGSAGSVTFGQLLARNNHTAKTIKYLKIDIEGGERKGLEEWIKSGAMDNVLQVGVELHHTVNFAKQYWQISKGLHRLGFVYISYDPNLCVGRGPTYFHCVEVVFRKTTLDCPPLDKALD